MTRSPSTPRTRSAGSTTAHIVDPHRTRAGRMVGRLRVLPDVCFERLVAPLPWRWQVDRPLKCGLKASLSKMAREILQPSTIRRTSSSSPRRLEKMRGGASGSAERSVSLLRLFGPADIDRDGDAGAFKQLDPVGVRTRSRSAMKWIWMSGRSSSSGRVRTKATACEMGLAAGPLPRRSQLRPCRTQPVRRGLGVIGADVDVAGHPGGGMLLQVVADARRVRDHGDAEAGRDRPRARSPERIRIAGDAMAPAERMISLSASHLVLHAPPRV